MLQMKDKTCDMADCVDTNMYRESKYAESNSKDYSDRTNLCCQGSRAQTLCSLNCSHGCTVSNCERYDIFILFMYTIFPYLLPELPLKHWKSGTLCEPLLYGYFDL
jgi:hypothetical protein